MGRSGGDRLSCKKGSTHPTSSQIPTWWRSEIILYFTFFLCGKFHIGNGYLFHWEFALMLYLPPPPSSLFSQIIEPLVSKQWFVSMEPLAEKALRVVEKRELTIIPERFEKVYGFVLLHIALFQLQ
jgi:hypothetical protein